MPKITLGRAGTKKVEIDIDVLLKTRLLVQANSGGGKSFLLRRLAEQLFGKVPVLIIDPEGEFATLREKFGYVLVGKGGETPADPRSAQVVAHKLLELRASAVCDIYELKPETRHHWVRLFLEALIDAPKNLWHHTVVIVDESHLFMPEKGQGESEAYGAMVDMATRGRKRGFCALFATQRLSKLSKNGTAELLNRLVGPTFEDIDLDRAADLLSVLRTDRQAFFKEMKVLEPGHFYGFGRAIANERTLIKVGSVETTHPEIGSAKFAAEPPPPPEKVKALLPKLADLPKEAEEKARTEADLRAEIRSLKGQLTARPKVETSKPVVREVSVIKPKDLVRLERAMETADRAAGKIQNALGALRGFADQIRGSVKSIEHRQRIAPMVPAKVSMPVRLPIPTSHSENGNGGPLDKAERSILSVLAQYPEGCAIGKIALLAGYRISGGFRNSLSSLRSKGYLKGPNTGIIKITQEGMDALGSDYTALPNGPDLAEYWLRHPSFGQCERKALKVLLDNPDGCDIATLAQASGYEVSGGFRNALSSLRTAGVLVGRNTEKMTVCEDLLC